MTSSGNESVKFFRMLHLFLSNQQTAGLVLQTAENIYNKEFVLLKV